MELGRQVDETLAHILGRVIFTAVDDKIFNTIQEDEYERTNENFHKLDLIEDVGIQRRIDYEGW